MTWQRIDEGTYIDDTLVTCAEYQLFIDEMREQGMYYQPDHWTSYQFPAGQAQEPILGMRYSDAIGFCEWLTIREEGTWRFRLPNYAESKSFPISIIALDRGYWIINDNDLPIFSWVGPIPKDVRLLQGHKAFVFDFEQRMFFGRIRVDNYQDYFDEAFLRARENGASLSKGIELAHDIEQALDRLQHYTDQYPDRRLSPEYFDECERAIKLSSTLKRTLEQIDYTKAIDLALDFARNIYDKRYLTRAFEIWIDLITLQERIAGRSPAFEGIRLVKERIR